MSKWILIIAWASNGTGFTMQEFDTEYACQVAKVWAKNASTRGPAQAVCMNKSTGEMK